MQLRPLDRALWVVLSCWWSRWRQALQLVQPETVIAWQRRGFHWYWQWKSRPRQVGRPGVSRDVVDLIASMHQANPLWGAPRIHGELLKLGITVAQSTVSKYLPHPARRPPSQSWRTFLHNHLVEMLAIDFAVVPTVTGHLLFVFVVLSLLRRRVLHVNVTAHPTAAWTAQQVVEAVPWTTSYRYIVRDRDAIYGEGFQRRVNALGLEQVVIAARSPWQNAYAERFIGSLRRECLDHVLAAPSVRAADGGVKSRPMGFSEWTGHPAGATGAAERRTARSLPLLSAHFYDHGVIRTPGARLFPRRTVLNDGAIRPRTARIGRSQFIRKSNGFRLRATIGEW